MAKLTKLIDYAYLKEETDLPQNLDNDDLEKKIYRAQETLRMLMGDAFYQDYISQYPSFTTSSYSTVYPYVKQYLAHQTFEHYVVMANYKPTRSGFRVHSEENSVVVTDVQMSIIIKDAKQQTQQYKNLLVDYLNGHAADFPLYSQRCNTNLTGNGFHISAVKNKNKKEYHGKYCGCGCHD